LELSGWEHIYEHNSRGLMMQPKISVLAVLLIACCWGCNNSSVAPGQIPVTVDSPAYLKCASLDTKANSVSKSVAKEYQQAFTRLEEKCNEGPEAIADMAQVAVSALEKKGKRTTRLSFLGHLYDSIPEESAPTDCKDAAAMVWELLERE
jgi:hypothetical protein